MSPKLANVRSKHASEPSRTRFSKPVQVAAIVRENLEFVDALIKVSG
jgi:hypothetical protein